MASTSRTNHIEEDGDVEEELERFDDFTLASSWERFISDIEATCRLWLADGTKNLLDKGAVRLDFTKDIYKVQSDLKNVSKSYCMEYYFPVDTNARMEDWDCKLHDLQLCFGVKEFLVIAPQSASGVVLDAPEASKLLSAVAIALSNCSSLWPAFVPVHDPSRRAYIGIQNMGTVYTRRFEGDLISSQVPVKLMHLEGLYELFVSKFVYSTVDFSMHLFRVHFTMKLTYQTLSYDDENDDSMEEDISVNMEPMQNGGEIRNRKQWDDDCPWSEWYSAEDPIKGFDLVATWSNRIVESSLEMAEMENASPHEAEKWTLLPNLSTSLIDSSQGNRIGFSSQLQLLVDALNMSFEAQFMEDFVSVENPGSDNLKSSMVVPPPSVIDRVLKDLFHEGTKVPDFRKGDHRFSRAIKGAPLESLFTQFCLHSLWFGNCNIRTVAVLWIEFVREVRWCWEESQPLPKMPVDGSVDLSTCLINQKLQLLAICIDRKREMNEEFQDCIGGEDPIEAYIKEDNQVGFTNEPQMHHEDTYWKRDSPSTGPSTSGAKLGENVEVGGSAYQHKTSDSLRRGSAGPTGSTMLLKSFQSLHAPYTQDPPLMTEDMHEERLQAVEAFGDSLNFSGQLEKDILLSDMSAFKAANPDAVFEDFIRWHSPGDWENDETEKVDPSRGPAVERSAENWPPRGRLSRRMSEHGNLWRKLWNDAPALPVYEQKPLLDPNREGEKILHYLETVRPHQLLEQMVCTAFRASADTLSLTNFGGLKQMITKLEQLYLTMKTSLRPLQANNLPDKDETIEDLRRLCVVLQHIEKLLAAAASLHRKFLEAPRLSETIFSDFYNSYLPTMGMNSKDESTRMEFGIRQDVKVRERQVVSNFFPPPSANQSWRKVLSMGNLLNGHEPILREIIFSKRDTTDGNHYAATNPRGHREEIETYRMYVCGTSNDLRAALSVTSCD